MSHISVESDELRGTLDRMRTLLDALAVRGLRACGTDELAQLRVFTDDLERSGAGHTAALLTALHTHIEKADRAAAPALLTAQTAVRLLERLLTLRVAAAHYKAALETPAPQTTAETADDTQGGED